MTARAILGGNEFLDGYSVYQSPKGFLHIVTFGMTELYAEADAFGGEWNKKPAAEAVGIFHIINMTLSCAYLSQGPDCMPASGCTECARLFSPSAKNAAFSVPSGSCAAFSVKYVHFS